MNNLKEFTYRLSYFIVLVFLTELLFFALFFGVLKVLGFFNPLRSGEQFTFLHPEYAWFFLFIAIAIGVFIFQIFQRKKVIATFAKAKSLDLVLTPVSTKKLYYTYFLIRNVIAFAVIALMMPAYGHKPIYGEVVDTEMVFAVDLSNSMNTRDMESEESRLTVVKRLMNQIINKTASSQTGLVVFAGNAYVQFPLTSDISIVKMYIEELTTDLLSNQGTNISSALKEASDLFSKGKVKKVLFLLTDGEDHEGKMKEAYEAIQKKNIDVFVVGIGTENGGIILENDSPQARYLKDAEGQAIISRVNKGMLQEIAEATKGKMLLTSASFPDIYQFLTEINDFSSRKVVNLEFETRANRYQWFLGIALLFLVLFMGKNLFLKR